MLFRLRHRLPTRVKLGIYYALFHSQLSYLVEAWGCATSSRLKSVQVLQNDALWNVFDLPRLTPRSQLYTEERSILPVRGLYKLGLVKSVWNSLRRRGRGAAKFGCALHGHQTRGRRLLTRPRARTDYGLSRISFAGATYFNDLPDFVKEANNFRTFAMRARRHYLASAQEMNTFLTY